MKRIVFLGGCMIALLLASFADAYLQKQKAGAVWMGETETEAVSFAKTEDGAESKIRVLLKTGDYAQDYHTEICVSSTHGFCVSDGTKSCAYQAGTRVEFQKDETGAITLAADGVQSEEFQKAQTFWLTADEGKLELPDLSRETDNRAYEGSLEIRCVEQGLLLINELPLEEYLCGVIPSEMPSSYPAEALKAQAVCARTYALWQMREKSLEKYGADVDDSVSFQVYHNQDATEETDAAVSGTAGRILTQNGEMVETLYYSTSCGLELMEDLSGETAVEAFLTTGGENACEAEEPWYRWKTEILLENLEGVEELRIRERAESGAVSLLEAVYENGNTTTLEGEYNIREFLGRANGSVTLQSGEMVENMTLLPSAFFILQPEYENGELFGYQTIGGGYGHGLGMSQNGAKHLALEGADYIEILKTYYGADTTVELA